MPKTAPFSSSVAFLTPPTFPAPAPRKRFFDPLPKKILGFRTRKGRPPRRQYLARARLEFRAGLRVVGIFAGAGVWYLLRPAGLCGWWIAGRPVGGWLALCCACGPARHGISARACAFGISCACPAVGAGGWLAVLPTAGAGRRPADRLPAVPTRRPHRSRPRPPAAGGGSAAATACRAGLPICRRAGRSRRRGYLPRPVSSPDKLS